MENNNPKNNKKTTNDNNNRHSQKKKQPNPFIRFSGMAFQMGVTIGLAVWGGRALDDYFQTEKPLFTLGCSLLGVFAAIYMVIKDLNKG